MSSHGFRESGIAARIYKRGSSPVWTVSFRVGGRKVQRSTEETGKDRALGRAKEIVREELREALLDIEAGSDLTLGQLFAAYRRHHMPTLSPARQREAASRIKMFSEAWGTDLAVADVDASRIRAYCQKRRDLEIVAPAFRETDEGQRKRGYRKPRPIRDGGLDAELRWLNSVFNFGVDHRLGGRPLLNRNPLPRSAKARRKMGWPKEKNPRRPIASHERYLETMKHVDTIDPRGRLGCILTLARYTARRESAICELRASDLLLSGDRLVRALAAEGQDVQLAEHMPHGAIRWSADSDKMGVLFITPIGPEVRRALDAYLRENPRMGDVPLFPAPKDAAKPISRDLASKWLLRAEKLAGLPKLAGGVFHPYRRLWATERKHMPALDVAAAGGWTDTQALTLIYQAADPRGVLAAVTAPPVETGTG